MLHAEPSLTEVDVLLGLRPAVDRDASIRQYSQVDHVLDGAGSGPVEMRVLGPLEVVGPTGPIDIRHGLPRALLSVLIVRRGEVVPTGALVDELWFDRIPANPANALQVQVSYVRRQLRPLEQVVRIEREGFGYRLVADADVVDSTRFERVVQEASVLLAGSPATREAVAALSAVDRALGWWRGSAYGDASQLTIVEPERHRLELLRLVALERRGTLLDRLGRHAEAVAWLEPLAEANPLREGLWVALIGALYRDGRQVDALRTYASARARLVDEVGIEPGPELRALERAILDQDPRLLLPGTSPDPVGSARPTPTTITSPGTPDDRAAAPARQTPRRRVPASMTPLIGRAWELDQVREQLASNRLLTLVGPGGVGKSRLAFEAAREVTAPVTVLELGGVDDPAAVPWLIASSVPVPTEPGSDPLDVVTGRIGDDEWVMVFDTCEHVVDAIAGIVARLLTTCPGLRVLATSRQSLGVDGEFAWPVPLLELADADTTRAIEAAAAPAVRLFVERARATNPSFELGDGNARAVADVCRALDGLPLAIELAAARTGVLSVEAIRDRLADRFGLLTRGRRDAAARQHSLESTVGWSFDQLSEPEQQFFAALGIFGGSFDLQSAAAVAAVDDDTALDVMTSLVDRSLVVSDGRDRFRLLDTLRAYARDRLAERDPSRAGVRAAERRLATWMADLVVNVDPSLLVDASNIRAALDWAFGPDGDRVIGARIIGSMAGSLALTGEFAEADRWLTMALDADCGDEAMARVLRGVAVIAMYQGQYEEAAAAADKGYRRALASGIDRLVAVCAITLGSAVWGAGELDRSTTLLRSAAEFFDTTGEIRGRGLALARLARTLSDLGDTDAVEIAAAAVDDLEATHDDWIRVVALDHLAYALLAAGDLRAAAVRAEQAIDLAARIGSLSGQLAALALLGRIRLADGALDDARAAQRRVVSAALRVRNFGAVVEGLEGFADVLIAGGRHSQAAIVLGAADAARDKGRVNSSTHHSLRREARLEELQRVLGSDRTETERRSGRRIDPLETFTRLGDPTTAP